MNARHKGGATLQVLVSVVLIAAALATAYLLTRNQDAPPPTEGGHVHGATAGGASSSGPVAIPDLEARRIGVTYAAVERGTLGADIVTVGQLAYDETRVRAISPRVEGWVEELFVNFTGQDVRAGAPLLRIHSPMLVTAQDELLLAARLVREVQGGTEEAKRSAVDLLESARRRLAFWEIPAADIAAIEQSGEVTRTMTLRAPVGGVVVEKNVVAGQRVMEGEALFRIADLGTVWVEAEIFERDVAAVRLGARATVTLEAYPGETWTGTVAYVYPSVDPQTRTVRVRIELQNSRRRLNPGMYATVHMAGARRQDVASVPRSAVLASGARSIVFVRRADGQLEPREVTVGLATADRIEILRGLQVGDTVVASATFLVDAESNLRSSLGGMAGMPGMQMPAPAASPATPERKDTTPAMDLSEHAGHDTATRRPE